MKKPFVMPSLAKDMKTGTIVKWHNKSGDKLLAGEIFVEIETDKVNMEVEVPFDGVLLSIEKKEGEEVPVGTILAYIDSVKE